MGFVVSGIAHHFYREVKLLSILKSCELFKSLHLFIEGRKSEFGFSEVFEDFLGMRELVDFVRVGKPIHSDFHLVQFPLFVTTDLGYEGLLDFDVHFGGESEEVGVRFGECHTMLS